MDNKSVCCVIITYNIGQRLYRCFNSVYDQVGKVIIVDNGSDEETIRVLNDLKLKDRVEIVYNGQNYGIAKALNIGVKYAIDNKFPWVLTLDNDSKVTPDMVTSMLNTFEIAKVNEGEKLVSIFPECLEENFQEGNVEMTSCINNNKYKIIEGSITSGNLVKTSVFKEVGFFEEKYFIDQVDNEFCLRLFSKDYKHIICEGSILIHNLGDPKKTRFLWNNKVVYSNHNAMRRYYIMRNRLDFWKKYSYLSTEMIKKDKIACVKELAKVILYEKDKIAKMKSVFRGIRDYRRNKFNTFD